jgi:hypothetical protein
MQIKKNKPKNELPHLGLIIGGPKVGKSTLCASIPNALIADLESCGYSHIECEALAIIKNLSDLDEVIKTFFSSQYDVLVLDHLKMMTNWYSEKIASSNNVKTVEHVGFGKGQSELKHDVFKLFSNIRAEISRTGKRVVLVAHSTDRKGETRLDVDGKLDTMITGMVDYIGNVYRVGPTVKINFKSQTGSEFGCRNKNLSKYNDVADWEKLVEVANG